MAIQSLPINMNSITSFVSKYPDLKMVVGLYMMAYDELYNKESVYEITMNDVEENQFIEKYKSLGYKIADTDYFGQSDLVALFMVFIIDIEDGKR